MSSVRDKISQLTASRENLVQKPVVPTNLIVNSIDLQTPYNSLVVYKAGRFAQFSKAQVDEFRQVFQKYDVDKDQFLNLEEVKGMMEKLGVTKTHLQTKAMIKEVDKDQDG